MDLEFVPWPWLRCDSCFPHVIHGPGQVPGHPEESHHSASVMYSIYCTYLISSTGYFGAACPQAAGLRMKRLLTLRCVLFVKCKNQNKNLQTDIISYGKNMNFDDKIVYRGRRSIQQVVLHCIYVLLPLGCDEILSNPSVTQEAVKQYIQWWTLKSADPCNKRWWRLY